MRSVVILIITSHKNGIDMEQPSYPHKSYIYSHALDPSTDSHIIIVN